MSGTENGTSVTRREWGCGPAVLLVPVLLAAWLLAAGTCATLDLVFGTRSGGRPW